MKLKHVNMKKKIPPLKILEMMEAHSHRDYLETIRQEENYL